MLLGLLGLCITYCRDRMTPRPMKRSRKLCVVRILQSRSLFMITLVQTGAISAVSQSLFERMIFRCQRGDRKRERPIPHRLDPLYFAQSVSRQCILEVYYVSYVAAMLIDRVHSFENTEAPITDPATGEIVRPHAHTHLIFYVQQILNET